MMYAAMGDIYAEDYNFIIIALFVWILFNVSLLSIVWNLKYNKKRNKIIIFLIFNYFLIYYWLSKYIFYTVYNAYKISELNNV